MHLKSVEMVGFKSFADRTLVDLKEGISAVVGPNGCGKSNIVDAIRWCLGEMSPRSLRSKQMLDVIFAGAAGRAAQNMAEVTLTFDNSSRLLPTDYTEIQVSRRLFRSGESEYFLNKTQCRLKDIRDLFLDTGLSDGYSILAQGEVDFIINAKPEERREMFEEAAGIIKYKHRREESLRKLEKVELDINRLNDILSVVKEQMDSLETAVKKATLYQKLRAELKDLEVADAVLQLKKSEEGIAATRAQTDTLQRQLQEAVTRLDVSEAEWTQIRVDQDALEKEIFDGRNGMLELEREMNAADNAIQLARAREQQYAGQEKKCREEIRTAEENLESLRKRLEETEKEFAATQTYTQSLQETAEKEKQAWKDAEKDRGEQEEGRKLLLEEIFEMAGQSSELQNLKNANTSAHLHKQSDIAATQKELEKIVSEKIRLAEESTGLNQMLLNFEDSQTTAQKDIADLMQNLISEEQNLAQILSDIQNLRSGLIQKQTQLSSLQESFEGNPYKKGTQAVLNRGFDGLKGVVGVLLKYSGHGSRWVESALGNRINHLVFETQADAEAALKWLKEQNLGRAVCLILDKIPEVQAPDLGAVANANSLLNFAQCPPELEKLRKYLLATSFVAGDTLYDQGTIDGGSDLSESAGAENPESATQNQFLLKETLESGIRGHSADLSAREDALVMVQQKIKELKELLTEKEKAMHKLQVEQSHSKDVLGSKNEQIEICAREINFLREKMEGNEKELQSLMAAADDIQEKINRLSLAQKQKEKERDDLDLQIRVKQDEEHALQLKAKDSEVRFELLEKNLEKIEESLTEFRSNLEQRERTIADSTREIEVCRLNQEQAAETVKSQSLKVQELQNEKNLLSARIETLLQTKSESDGRSAALQTRIQEVRDQQTLLAGQLHQVEMDLRTLENERGNVVRRLEENYQMTPEQALEQMASKEIDVSPEEIQKLKKRVESMSNSVNLEAPEQYLQLQERFNFLNSQTQDLSQAREDLKSAIKQINTTTREQFKETFDKVRQNFRSVYATLFQGGQADLVFTDEQNLLETGIDIFAQPAGKKLQNISLLSGGEKALTAIALLFSFFLVKPSPFCIMDEVDAPWDPANVDRFLKLLRDFSAKTQFLVVTHSPRTMEIADILYGVTMEEFGVSKVISAKLKKQSSPNPELASTQA